MINVDMSMGISNLPSCQNNLDFHMKVVVEIISVLFYLKGGGGGEKESYRGRLE